LTCAAEEAEDFGHRRLSARNNKTKPHANVAGVPTAQIAIGGLPHGHQSGSTMTGVAAKTKRKQPRTPHHHHRACIDQQDKIP